VSSSLIGRTLGKYKIVELVGHGGMATVYKGYQDDVDRNVAVKVLPPHPGQSAAFVERFRQEARTIARLSHPHILPLYDYGHEDDILYLVMPYIDGGSLADRVRRGKMSFNDIERLLSQMASALDFAHKQGVIHRDIKPDNILINREGYAILSDFGIAKLVETTGMTTTGGMVGTPAYIAPEQAQNNTIDGRADIYSLGVVVYEMLTGVQPFRSDTPMQTILKHLTAPPPRVSESLEGTPPSVDVIVGRALAKEANDRYQTATAFAEDFKRAINGQELAPFSAARTVIDPNMSMMARNLTSAPSSLTPFPPTATSPPPGYTYTPVPGYGATPPPGYTLTPIPTTVPNPTLTTSPSNPLILIGGFAIIGTLLMVVLLILLNESRQDRTDRIAENATAQAGIVIETDTQAQASLEAVAVPTQVAAVNQPRRVGSLSYTTTTLPGDTILLSVNDLPPAPSGQQYVAWLVNTTDDETLRIGTLTVDPRGSGVLTYTDDKSLATAYNRTFITSESTDTDTPTGEPVFFGEIPAAVVQALYQILIESPDGIIAGATPTPDLTSDYPPPPPAGSSLLDGALTEAEIANQHAGLASRATNVGGLHTHAEHTINILRGTEADLNNNGRGENPGRGYGVGVFLDRIDATLLDAAADATLPVQNQIELIRVCITNARSWMDEVIGYETQFVVAETLESAQDLLPASTSAAAAILEGIDVNENGSVEPYEGECGLQQISEFGVSVANLDIYPASE